MKTRSTTMFSAAALAFGLFSATAHSATFNQTIGDQWKQQCSGQGRYTCCKQKEKACIAEGVGESNCGQRYKQCVKLFRPGREASQTDAPGNAGVFDPGRSTPGGLVRHRFSGSAIMK